MFIRLAERLLAPDASICANKTQRGGSTSVKATSLEFQYALP